VNFNAELGSFGSRIPYGFHYKWPRRQRGGPISAIWKNGVQVYSNKTNVPFWVCSFCYAKTDKDPHAQIAIYKASGTTHIREHLLKAHHVTKDGSIRSPNSNRLKELQRQRRERTANNLRPLAL
jgi:hypothetical protein